MIFGVQYDISPKDPSDHDMPTFTLRMVPPWMQIWFCSSDPQAQGTYFDT